MEPAFVALATMAFAAWIGLAFRSASRELTKPRAPSTEKIRVMSDGIFIGEDFTHYRTITRARVEERAFDNQTASEPGGSTLRPRRVDVVVVKLNSGEEQVGFGSSALAKSIQENADRSKANQQMHPELQRGNRSAREWIESYAPSASNYRVATLVPEQLFQIVGDGTMPPTVRASAAMRLRRENDSVGLRLSTIAAGVGYEPLRLALNSIAKGERGEVHDGLEALVDPPIEVTPSADADD